MALLFVLTVVIALAVWWGGERLRRHRGLKNEFSRKLVHSIHAGLIAVWPFIIGYTFVIAIEILFILVVAASRYLFENLESEKGWRTYLAGMYKVGRTSYGEFTFPVGVIVAALLAQSKWVYLAAVLCLGLADAVAALIGKRFGKRNSYMILGQAKSFAGSLGFYVTALVIMAAILLLSPEAFSGQLALIIIGLPLLLAVAENLGVYGIDNLLIPLIAVVALNALL